MKKIFFDAVGWKSYCNTKKMLYCGAGRAGAGRWACWRWARRQGVRGVPAGRAWARGRGRRWALGRAGDRGAQVLGRAGRAWQAQALAGARTRADAQAGVARAAGGRWVGAWGARSRARRQARALRERAGQGWLGAGRAAWARGLALGCALGALGLFFARFDSVFS